MSEGGRGIRLFGEYITFNANWNMEYANHLLRPAHRLVWCMPKLSLNAVTFTLFLVSSNMVQIEMNLFIMAYIIEDGGLDYAKVSTQGRDYKLMYTSVTDIKNFTHSLKIYMCKALWLLYWMLHNPDRMTPISNICCWLATYNIPLSRMLISGMVFWVHFGAALMKTVAFFLSPFTQEFCC